MFHVKHSPVKGRGAQSGAVPFRFGLAEREVDGEWCDYVQTLDGPPVKLRTTVTEERPKSILTVNRRSIGTPYRRAKRTPLPLCGLVDAGRMFRAAGGVGRA